MTTAAYLIAINSKIRRPFVLPIITDVTSDKREAVRREKLRIAEAQNGGGVLSRKTVGLTVPEAAERYATRRESEISPFDSSAGG